MKKGKILFFSLYISGLFLLLFIPLIWGNFFSNSWFYHLGDSFSSVAISSDGEYIVAGAFNGRVYLFDKDSRKPLWSYETGHEITSVAISSNGDDIVAGSRDRMVYMFNKLVSTPLWSYNTGADVLSVAISSDGNYLVSGSENGNVILFEKSSSTPLWSNSTGYEIKNLDISSDGQNIVAIGQFFTFYLFNKTSPIPELSYSLTDYPISVAISSDGKSIVAGTVDDKVYLFSNSSSTPLWTYSGYDEIRSVSISSNGQYIAAGGLGQYVYFFENSSSTPLWTYRTFNNVESVSISSNGDYLAAGTFGSGEQQKSYCFHKSSQSPLWTVQGGGKTAISSNGKYIASIPGLKLFFFEVESQFNLSDFNTYTMIVLTIGGVGLVISIIVVVARRKKLKARGIRVFISHAVDDFSKYRIEEIAKYLESHPEINHVYYCEEDLTGNIDDWMRKTVPRCQLLIFFSTENALKSEDCMNELKIARKLNIQITPVLGVNLKWEDLENLNINRELGQEFDPMEFDQFKESIYNYIIKFAQDLEKEILEKKKIKK
ncbi:MAG: PQQ-binding-like beta-propeller repeat protein [Candidatus Hodarchaeota archaeon]